MFSFASVGVASPTPSPSANSCTGVATCLYNGVSNAILTASGVIDFWSDPWGNTFKALQSSARQLSDSVLPAVTDATLPDLNAGWFVQAYAVTFALAILLAVALLLPQVVRAARGVLSGRELLDSIGIYFPLFLIGSMFGPPFGVILVRFFGSMSDTIIHWGVTSTAGTVTSKFRQMLSAQDASGIAGGAPVADLLVLGVLLGLLLVVVMLIIQLVTLYFTGVLLPLGLVWLIDPGRRRFGTRIVSLWVGLLAAHPLLFLLLSVAYLMVGGNIDAFGSGASLQKTVTLIVALLALFVAGLSPVALMRLAPVMLSGGGTAAAGASMPAIGLRSMSDADDRYGAHVPVPDGPPSGGGGGTGGDGGRAAPESVGSSVSDRAADDGPAPSVSGTSSEGRRSAGRTVELNGEPVLIGAAPEAAPAEGAAAGLGAAGAAGAAGGGAAAAGEGAVIAAGAGESATGLGAAIGVPTMLVGVGLAGMRGAKKVGDGVIEKAAAPVEDGERFGSERLHE
jgi:type IV secretion system protein TrbL